MKNTNTHTIGGKALAIGLAGTLVLAAGAKTFESNYKLIKNQVPSKTAQVLAFNAFNGEFTKEPVKNPAEDLTLEELVAIMPESAASLGLLEEGSRRSRRRRNR